MKDGKRDYKRENKLYNSKHIAERSERTVLRRQSNKAGTTHKGDGLQIDHIKPLSKGGTSAKNNLRVEKASINESFSRNKDGSLKKNNGAARARKKG